MAELATIARPYAEALFRVANSGNLSGWSDQVTKMTQVATHPDIKMLADNPKVSDQQMADVFLSAMKSSLGSEAKNFIGMLIQNGRLSLLPEIAVQFHALRNAQEGAADAEIISAFEMSDAQVKELIATLDRKFGRKLKPSVTVDDEVLDTSVRACFQKMHTSLLS